MIATVIGAEGLDFHGYKYPGWATTFGWMLSLSSVSAIPILAGVHWFKKYFNSPQNEGEKMMINKSSLNQALNPISRSECNRSQHHLQYFNNNFSHLCVKCILELLEFLVSTAYSEKVINI